jgi:ankyrin repeat protein
LLTGGADPNLATSNGATPLMMAAQGGNADVVKALIARGADVNAKEKVKNETALMIAASYGRADVIRALTAHGAELAATTKVLDMAVFNKEEGERLAQFQQQQAAQAAASGRGNAARPRDVEGSTPTPSRVSSASTTTPSWSPTGAGCRRSISPRVRAGSRR